MACQKKVYANSLFEKLGLTLVGIHRLPKLQLRIWLTVIVWKLTKLYHFSIGLFEYPENSSCNRRKGFKCDEDLSITVCHNLRNHFLEVWEPAQTYKFRIL